MLRAAALEAGFTRFRPVLMTALAMVIGMLPMAFALGEGGEQNAPLGRAVIGGLLVATVATLFFVPAVFSLLHPGSGTPETPGASHPEPARLNRSPWRRKITNSRHATPPPRNLRRIGIIAAVAAILIAAFGILQRRSHEAEVTQWTTQQAIPTVAVITPRDRRRGAASGAARHRASLVRGTDLCPRPRLSEELEFRLRRPCEEGRRAGRDRNPRPRCPMAAAQAKLNSARAVVKVREAEKQFAESTYQRWRDSPKGVVSVQEQESKQADYNSAAARLNSAIAEVAADQGEVDRLQALESFKKITRAVRRRRDRARDRYRRADQCRQRHRRRQRTRTVSRRRHPQDADLRAGAAAIVGRHRKRADRRAALAAISGQDL